MGASFLLYASETIYSEREIAKNKRLQESKSSEQEEPWLSVLINYAKPCDMHRQIRSCNFTLK